jgi:hypothetical protein
MNFSEECRFQVAPSFGPFAVTKSDGDRHRIN